MGRFQRLQTFAPSSFSALGGGHSRFVGMGRQGDYGTSNDPDTHQSYTLLTTPQYLPTFAKGIGHYGGCACGPQGTYGASEQSAGPEDGSYEEYLQYVPFLREFIVGEDPREEIAIIQAKIQNYKKLKRQTGVGLLKTFYSNEIRKLEARLAALEKLAAEAQTSASTTQTAKVVGIGVTTLVGVSVIAIGAYFILKARREAEETKTIRARRLTMVG